MSGLGKSEFWQNNREDPPEALGSKISGPASRKAHRERKKLMARQRRRRENRRWRNLR